MDSLKNQSPNSKTFGILASNVPPDFFINREEAKKYFRRFGKVKLITFRPKRQMLLVEYSNEESMENALDIAGEYNGKLFQVQRHTPTPKKKKQKATDPDWVEDPEVRSEVEAMLGTRVPVRSFDLRSDAMQVDSSEGGKQELAKSFKKSWPTPKSKGKKAIEKTTQEMTDLLHIIKSPAHTVEDKYKILDARDKLIRLRLKKGELEKIGATVGTCPDMCPEKERLMREVQHQVSIYEQEDIGRGMNPRLAVKQYSRSSADQEAALPQELRPVSVLQMTMGYLMHKIMGLCDNTDVNIAEWYHFLWDRTRGIRKDITQQELCCQGSVELVEQCARFHIFCSARLVSEDPSVFDQKINTENLTKCLQTLKYMYHDLQLKGESCKNEPEFRAYIILLNLNDGNFMWEVQHLKKEIQDSHHVKFALDVYSSLDKNNYVKFFKLVSNTTFLNACILMRYFVQVRLSAIKTLLKCYSPRISQTTLPVSYLTRILAFEHDQATAEFLECFGLDADLEYNRVLLNRKSFSSPDYPYVLERAMNLVETKRIYSVGEIVCGKELPEKLYENHTPNNSFDHRGFLKLTADFIEEEQEQEIKTVIPKNDIPNVEPIPKIDADVFNQKPQQPKEVTALNPPINTNTNFFSFAPTKNSSWPKQTNIFGSVAKSSHSTVDLVDAPEETQQILPDETEKENKRIEEDKRLKIIKKQKEDEERQIRLLQEAAAARKHLERLEQEKRRLEELQKILEEKEREKKRQAELERAKKAKEEERERKRLEEETRLKRMQMVIDVQTVLDNLLDKVEQKLENEKLAEIRSNIKRRKLLKYAGKWREMARRNRKRKAMDFEPLWISDRTLREEAKELMNFEDCLSVIKKYKTGKSFDVDLDNLQVLKPIQLIPLIESTIVKSSREVEKKVLSEIYWKVTVSLPEKKEFPRGLNHLESTLNTIFQWNENKNILLEQSKSHPILTCCIEKQIDIHDQGDSNGLIFIADSYNDLLRKRLVTNLKNYGVLVKIPIVLILQNDDKSSSHMDGLKKILSFSDYDVIIGKFTNNNLQHLLKKALIFLSDKVQKTPPLQLDTLRNFLTRHLCSDIWRKANSLSKWNSNYKECLKNPQIVLHLYNEAVDRIKSVILNESWHEYPKFPEVFRECLASDIPQCLPCDYRYFPNFFTKKYFAHLEKILNGLYLENIYEKWPPKNELELESLVHKYCKKTFKNYDRVFYKVMSVLLKNCCPTVNFEVIGNVLWTEVMEVLSLEKLEQIDFSLLPSLKVEKSVFNQLVVIYDVNFVNETLLCDWFYTNSEKIKREVEKLLRAKQFEPVKPATKQDNYDIDIDAMLKQLMETPRKANIDNKVEEEVKLCKNLMDDLQDSIIVHKKILETSGNMLKKIIN